MLRIEMPTHWVIISPETEKNIDISEARSASKSHLHISQFSDTFLTDVSQKLSPTSNRKEYSDREIVPFSFLFLLVLLCLEFFPYRKSASLGYFVIVVAVVVFVLLYFSPSFPNGSVCARFWISLFSRSVKLEHNSNFFSIQNRAQYISKARWAL